MWLASQVGASKELILITRGLPKWSKRWEVKVGFCVWSDLWRVLIGADQEWICNNNPLQIQFTSCVEETSFAIGARTWYILKYAGVCCIGIGIPNWNQPAIYSVIVSYTCFAVDFVREFRRIAFVSLYIPLDSGVLYLRDKRSRVHCQWVYGRICETMITNTITKNHSSHSF